MVNENEAGIIRRYEAQGWKTLRGGAPDFVFLKVDKGEIVDILFVEVKTVKDRLTYEQALYRKVLEKLGAKYKVETIHAGPVQSTSTHSILGQIRPDQTISHQPIPNHPTPSHTTLPQAIPPHPISPQSKSFRKEVI